ncbi:MAG: hypothetical protein UX31_C0006G0006 [Candidatus Nomurabacteria bacterium GW2011_GWA1_46_11]|uniref:Uncharacterized protein n=2 Tax=Parcubacteria group TaxID=1794811 RepID=A0A0G1NNB9_9BACT|nr:MAG: hypothetical protein UX29_C0004G0017 [Parcubacteria group bacterium GW2011_GWA2_46_10]KKU22094.1 MAG: hypothetical protein UX31_C0006G0006 [Candidatus Nomurabacteria bacterium GW2011_GWA1_46_11]
MSMDNQPEPLDYHYKTNLKLDYFILGADIAILGWTLVNLDWLPKERLYVYLIGAFWSLVALSVISGVLRQIYNAMLFGINHQSVYAAEIANQIERASMGGGSFINQQTGKMMLSEEFKKLANPHREKEKLGKEKYEKYSRCSQFYSNASICLLAIALFLLIITRILSL